MLLHLKALAALHPKAAHGHAMHMVDSAVAPAGCNLPGSQLDQDHSLQAAHRASAFAMLEQSLVELYCGLQALQCNDHIKSQAASLAAPLAKLVEEGASKLAQRTNGVTALLACCHIAAASHDADQTLKQNKVNS